MDQATRFAQITDRSQQTGWPEVLTDAITTYLGGTGTLAQVDQAWERFNNRAPLKELYKIRIVSAPEDGPLDALDLRVLDLFEQFGEIGRFLSSFPQRDVAQQIADHLRSRGMSEQTIRQRFFSDLGFVAFDMRHTPEPLTPIGRYLLATYLPAYAEEMFSAEKYWSSCFRLLLLVQPPVPDLIWQFAQQLERQEAGRSGLGFCARVLLKADPATYTPWARRLASQSNPLTTAGTKLAVVEALMEVDPAQHIDLVLEIAQLPITESFAPIQSLALQIGYAHDPVRFFPLVEAAVVTRNVSHSHSALLLLEKAPFAQARPALQRCVVESYARIGSQALEDLLKQPWAGQRAFLLTQLTHRSKRIRERAAAALKSQGVALP
jgi:hypothetical protein